MAEFRSKWLDWQPSGKKEGGFHSNHSAPLARFQNEGPELGGERAEEGVGPQPADAEEEFRKNTVSGQEPLFQKRPSRALRKLRKPTTDSAAEPNGDTDYFSITGLERDWAAAWARAQDGFAVHGISPTHETLQAATVLELWIADSGPPRPGVTFEDLKDWTQEIYRGRGSARVSADGRVVLRALGNNDSNVRRWGGVSSDDF